MGNKTIYYGILLQQDSQKDKPFKALDKQY
jgi:hypothetical protein